MATNNPTRTIVGSIPLDPYVPVMELNHWPTAQTEMMRLLDECARMGKEIERLREAFAWLSAWHKVPGQSDSYGDYGLNFIDRDEDGFYIDDTNLQPCKGIRYDSVIEAAVAGLALTSKSDDRK